MTVELFFDKANPPLGALFAASLINTSRCGIVEVKWSDRNSIGNSSPKQLSETPQGLLRQIAQLFEEVTLYGVSLLERTQIDHWLCYTQGPLAADSDFPVAISNLNKILGPATYFVGNKISIADLAIFASLFANKQWKNLDSGKASPSNVLRWYKFIEAQDFVNKVIRELNSTMLQAIRKGSLAEKNENECRAAGGRAREGKFIELPGAEMGKVVVRFPPEASGYLHVGHAKAALLNQYYQQAFDGKLIMRFDDTNPAKENTHFEKVILEDIAMLQIRPDRFTFTSDYFEVMGEYCEKMLKDGTAYVDDTDPEVMKQEREQKIESINRSNSIEKNFQIWEEMKKGTEYGQKCCVRAKIDMKSLNGCMRDPTIYRCKNEPHPRTGTKYKVYPTYDFACPIVDAIEGVTHTLRTMEYHDRDPQFYWFIDVLGLRKPYIWEYSRLSMTNTVLSKRKLTWFVEQGLVDGWDDPRMPTVRGVLRRGMTVEGLKEFIIAQGSSRSVVFMEWDKIWAFNKKVIDPIASRYTVVDYNTHVLVTVKNVKEECLSVPLHPKNPHMGMKSVWVGPKLLIDKADAECLKEGENATFINWGNLLIKKINRMNDKISSVEAEPNLDNKDYKKTLKLTFLCDTEKANVTPTFCVYFDHIISKPLLGKDEDFKQFIGHETRKNLQVIGDPELRKLKEGDIIQIQRRGFFRVDVPYKERSPFTCKEQPIILFHIPDGSAKDCPFFNTASKKVPQKEAVKNTNKQSKSNNKQASQKKEVEHTNKQSKSTEEQLSLQKEVKDKIEHPRSKGKQVSVQEGVENINTQPKIVENEVIIEDGVENLIKPLKSKDKKQVKKPPKNKDKNVTKQQDEDRIVKRQTRLGLEAKKEEDLPNWYSQVLTKSEMIEYYHVSGCYIYRPCSYMIWEEIKNWLDKEIKKLGVENCYFPIFVAKAMLEKEKTHIADFSPEVAWVTKSGDSEMSEPIAVRPTSETVMYPAYAKWIQSYRDLPIKLNQWNNVVRWEFKHPQPFLRTREFLWQEGHTAYATSEEATDEVTVILDLYAKVYTDLLAVPVIKGRKTEKEKFAGGNYTYTVEAYISASGRAIQGATSHHLGQNFSKMFDITFEDPVTQEKKYVYQNSWGITTRTIGVMVMTHSDNQGLVLPPNVASVQAVIVPCGITASLSEEGRNNLQSSCNKLEAELKTADIRVKGDYRDYYSPGWKFNHWELKGVPIRIELGPKDIEKGQLVAVRRDTGDKCIISLTEAIKEIRTLLKMIQDNLYTKACEDMKNHIVIFKDWNAFVPNLENKNLNLVPFCGSEECEDRIKIDSTRDDGPANTAAPSSGAKSLCIPLEQPTKILHTDKCIHPSCDKVPQFYALFGRSY